MNRIRTALLLFRLRLIEFQIFLIEANLDFNAKALDKARTKEMRLALKLCGLRKVEIPDLSKLHLLSPISKSTNLRVVK